MPIPASVRVLGKAYTVETVPPSDFADDELLGRCDIAKSRILLRAALSDEQQRETLLHELLHALEWAVGAGLKERQVGAISTALFALLRDNPDLLGIFVAE